MRHTHLVFYVAVLLLLFVTVANSRVIISEIMYAPRAYQDLFEFIEIYNTGPDTVTLTDWTLPIVKFTFPTSTIAPREHKVVVGNVNEFSRAYSTLRGSNRIIGGYTKPSDAEECANCLPDKGGEVRLLNAQGTVVSTVTYDNKKGWSQLASGFGSSLELVCYNDGIDINNAGYWVASVLPQRGDIHSEFGGTPGRGPQWQSCFGPKPLKFPESLVFTEIMYHPVGQKARVEVHEFIEVSNRQTEPLDVSGWRVVSDSGVRYSFPYGTTLPSGTHVVIAKSVNDFREVYGIASTPLGNYGGELGNGDCKVAIIDNNGFVRDYIRYDDKEPWPRAADAFGASSSFLPRTSPYKNEKQFLYKGQSLTRRTFAWKSDEPETWYTRSPTPGTPNLDTQNPLLPIFGKVKTNPKKNLVRADQEVTVEFELLPWPITGLTPTSVYVTHFRDDVFSDNPTIQTVRNTTAVWNDRDKVFRVVLPTRGVNSVVRYKIFAQFGAQVITSPHPKDPFEYHSIFYAPPPHPTTSTIHLFLRPAQWNNLRIWAEAGRWDGCKERDTWDNKIPCTVVYSDEGVVLPCTTRYQGSQFNRRNAVDIAGFPNGPPGGLKAYSWNIKVPGYGKIEKSKDIILHKMWQGCPMYETPILNRIMEEGGVMGSPTNFVRLNINGNFLRYMMVLYPGSSNWVDRWNEMLNRRCIHQRAEGIDGIGELYKVSGSFGDVGDSGRGDWSIFGPHCGHTDMDRYKATYSLATNKDFATHVTLATHIRFLHENILNDKIDLNARRKWLSDNFDINLLLNYIVVINWAGTWDQTLHNQLLYRRETDRKWTFHPWDADNLYNQPTSANLYAGDTTQLHHLRKAIIKNFRTELDNRFRLFQSTIHSKENMGRILNWANARYDRNQAKNEGFGRVTQNLDACIRQMTTFSNARWDWVNSQLGAFQGNAQAELKKITCPAKPDVVITNLNYTALPGIPVAFSSTRQTPTSVTLRWFPSNSFGRTIVSYNLRRATPGQQLALHPTSPSIPAGAVGAPVTFTDDNLTPGTVYRYSIGAVIRGTSRVHFSHVLSVTTENAPENVNNNNNNDNNNNNNNNNNNVEGDDNGAANAVEGNSATFYPTQPVTTPSLTVIIGISAGVVLGLIAILVVIYIFVVPKFIKKEEQV